MTAAAVDRARLSRITLDAVEVVDNVATRAWTMVDVLVLLGDDATASDLIEGLVQLATLYESMIVRQGAQLGAPVDIPDVREAARSTARLAARSAS